MHVIARPGASPLIIPGMIWLHWLQTLDESSPTNTSSFTERGWKHRNREIKTRTELCPAGTLAEGLKSVAPRQQVGHHIPKTTARGQWSRSGPDATYSSSHSLARCPPMRTLTVGFPARRRRKKNAHFPAKPVLGVPTPAPSLLPSARLSPSLCEPLKGTRNHLRPFEIFTFAGL